MIESWRELLYPLGFIASFSFGIRGLIQWLNSEMQKKSVVNPTFWRISIFSNLLLVLHSIIQFQFHVCLVQSCNFVISCRNLNLMKPKTKQVTFKTVCIFLAIAFVFAITVFSLQSYFLFDSAGSWFRIPTHAWSALEKPDIPLAWHLVGFVGVVLFASRFWVQWWSSEKAQESYLGVAFWWTSLIGDLMSVLYFMTIGDPVNFIGPALGMIAYVRNLMFLRKPPQPAIGEK